MIVYFGPVLELTLKLMVHKFQLLLTLNEAYNVKLRSILQLSTTFSICYLKAIH